MTKQEIIDRLIDVAKGMDFAACRQDPREMESTLRSQADFLRETAEGVGSPMTAEKISEFWQKIMNDYDQAIATDDTPSHKQMKAANGFLSRVIDYLIQNAPPDVVRAAYKDHVMSIVNEADKLSYCPSCPTSVFHSSPDSKCENKKR